MTLDIAREQPALLSEAVEQLLIHGDLEKLTVSQRLQYYLARCEAAKLDPRCRPFEYIRIKDKAGTYKLVLYAKKECAEQLNAIHGISHHRISDSIDEKAGVVEVVMQASAGSRTEVDCGVVSILGLEGDAFANAKMKAYTKAKRRSTLSFCGLGDMPDVSELDTMETQPCTQTGQAIPPDNQSGFASGQYASEAQAKELRAKLEGFLDLKRSKFRDFWTIKCDGEPPEIVRKNDDVCNIWQLDNHLTKEAFATGRLKPGGRDAEGIQQRNVGRYTAILYFRSDADKSWLVREANSYVEGLIAKMNERILREHPELQSEGDLEEATDADFDAIAGEGE